MHSFTVLLVLIGCATHATFALRAPACSEICPLLYQPVCGMDNSGTMKTFDNKCQFEYTACSNRGAAWRLISEERGCAAAPTLEQRTVCPLVCTPEYAPVCGVNNFGERRTFSNKCFFEGADCSNRADGWRLEGRSACKSHQGHTSGGSHDLTPRCPEICTLEYNPVCGVNNFGEHRTFGSKCFFESQSCNNRAAGWRLVDENVCETPEEKVGAGQHTKVSCPMICSMEYAPVCGVNNYGLHRTFENECYLEVVSCNNRAEGWRLTEDVKCAGPAEAFSSEEEEDVTCPEVCTQEYAPVCGINNFGERKTFSNNCFFKGADCNNRAAGWRLEGRSACKSHQEHTSGGSHELTPTCPEICTLEYNPVCGVNNFGERRTFGSKCFFESLSCNNRAAGWRLVKDNVCETPEEKVSAGQDTKVSCPMICSMEYAPVCGVNNYGLHRTFENECYLEVVSCNNRAEGWRLTEDVKCDGPAEAFSAEEEEDVTCPKVCTVEYAPVCGINNFGERKTFSNNCFFKGADCSNRAAGWRLVGRSIC